MSATGRSGTNAPAASDVAGRLRDAGFVRLVGAATGDALAASGVLARALDVRDRPFQISLATLAADATCATEADLTVAVGRDDPTADLSLAGGERAASETAFVAARELAAGSDDGAAIETESTVALALAGAVSAGRADGGPVAEAARELDFERRPGVGVPTTDLADGLAHSTLVHAPFSGDPEAAASAVESLDVEIENDGDEDASARDGVDQRALDEDDRRRVASLVALRAVGPDEVPPRGADAVERILRPFAGGPFATVGGYADVLDAVARERPGTAIALALGHDVREAALDAWRTHASAAHAAIRESATERYDGLYVVRAPAADAPVGTVARLVHDYRSPEPATLVVTDGAAAALADDGDPESLLGAAASAVDGVAETAGRTGRARFDTDDADATDFVAAVREEQ